MDSLSWAEGAYPIPTYESDCALFESESILPEMEMSQPIKKGHQENFFVFDALAGCQLLADVRINKKTVTLGNAML